MEDFQRDEISTSRNVSYRLNGGFPKWPLERPGSYAPGYEHLATEVWDVDKVKFFFSLAVGHWVLNEIVLTLGRGEDADRRYYHERITSQYTGTLPWWLAKLAASAAQEA